MIKNIKYATVCVSIILCMYLQIKLYSLKEL